MRIQACMRQPHFRTLSHMGEIPFTTHAVIHLSIDASDAKTLPVIVELDDVDEPAIALSVLRYIRYLQREGHYSYSALTKKVVAIGKLRDYYLIEKRGRSLAPGELRELLEDFLHDFDHGKVLGWRPASDKYYKQTRVAIHDYTKWLVGESNVLCSGIEARFLETCREAHLSSSYAEKSLLFHTKRRDRKKNRGRRKAHAGLTQYKPFPPHLVQELINLTKNRRDKFAFAALAYGGPRASELLHMFMEDIKLRGNEIHVELRHPTMSPMRWVTLSGKKMKGQRREYLKSVFGLLSRTEHGSLTSALGWKGIKYDDKKEHSADIYLIRDAGAYLLGLYRDYLHNVRAAAPHLNHPYCLVNKKGEPLNMDALEKQFELACKRLEKKYRISLKGYGLHSLRHFYGFYCADVLKMDLMLIMKYMHHLDPSSTAVYAHISPETAAKALRDAERKKLGLPTVEEREDISNQFRSTRYQDLNSLLAQGTTAFGILDTRKMTRKLR